MMLMVRRMTGPWWVAAVALVAAGCAGLSSNPAGAGSGVAATARSSTSASASAVNTATPADAVGRPARPIWLRSLQMTSATTGWALHYSGDPNSSSPVSMLLARTTDGGRTWTDVTPAAARPMLATADAEQVLDPVNGQRAYLAVTGATQQTSSSVHMTTVFSTTDGGRSWTDSAPLRAESTVSQVSFADPQHGFLLLGGDGGAMGHDAVWLYRTSDAGAHWLLAAATPAQTGTAAATQPSSGQISGNCDKNGLAFPTATTGWIASTCNTGLADSLLVSRDGGTSWSDQSLPLPDTTCAGGGCVVRGPRFLGGVGFVTVEPEARSVAPSMSPPTEARPGLRYRREPISPASASASTSPAPRTASPGPTAWRATRSRRPGSTRRPTPVAVGVHSPRCWPASQPGFRSGQLETD
jgi:photosystem II stability/assembly factor-like uncharacterized protein